MCFRNGKCIPVHRNILVARSPVFAELLRRAEEEQEGEKVRGKNLDVMPKYIRKCSFKVEKLRITDVRPETLEELVDYIYTDNSACVDKMARTLLAASELYQVSSSKSDVFPDPTVEPCFSQLPGLKTHCEKHLGEMICPNNVANYLLLAEKYKCQV